MPASTSLGFPYYLPSDPPSIHGATQGLASAVDTWALANVTPKCARVRGRTTPTNIAPATEIAVGLYDTELANVGDIAYGAGIFTFGTAGLYLWFATMYYVQGDDNVHRASCYVWQNGSVAPYSSGRTDVFLSQTYTTTVTTSGLIVGAAGDTIQQVNYHTNPSYLNGCIPRTFGLVRVSTL